MRNFLSGCSAVVLAAWLAPAVAPASAIGQGNCAFEQISPHVFVLFGSLADECPALGGRVPTNVGAVVAEDGVVLIDPGPPPAVMAHVLEKLAVVTDAPVIATIDTHIHGPYWLGNGAVRERFPDAAIYGHPRMIQRIEDGEGAFWAATLGDGGASDIVAPDRAVRDGDVLSFGEVSLTLHHPGHAHTDHDLLVEVQPDGVMFLGGLVVEPEIPSQGVPQDADFRGQIAAIKAVAEAPVAIFVPGRGAAGGRELPDRTARFLTDLMEAVRRHYDEGLLDWQMLPLLRADLAEYGAWYNFEALGRVVSEVFLQVEAEAF